MTFQEMVKQIEFLTVEERLSLIEVITHSLANGESKKADTESSLNRVIGLLKSEKPLPSKIEIREDYTDYLVDKYK